MGISSVSLEGDELVFRVRTRDYCVDTTIESYPKRMYCLVLDELSPFQKGIQSAHSIVEYSNKYPSKDTYIDWSRMWKSILVFEGGDRDEMRDVLEELILRNIDHAVYCNEELDNIVTSISVIADYRVYDKENCPDYEVWRNKKYPDSDGEPWKHYREWVDEVMGGEDNVFLRKLLTSKICNVE